METRPRIQNRQRSGSTNYVNTQHAPRPRLPRLNSNLSGQNNCRLFPIAAGFECEDGSAVPKTANVNSRLAAVEASACPRPKMRPSSRSLLISSELSLTHHHKGLLIENVTEGRV